MVPLFPIEDNGVMVFLQTDPATTNPELLINRFAQPADYPSGPNQTLGRKIDDPTVFQAFPDQHTCTLSGFEKLEFTIVPDWDHYWRLFSHSQ